MCGGLQSPALCSYTTCSHARPTFMIISSLVHHLPFVSYSFLNPVSMCMLSTGLFIPLCCSLGRLSVPIHSCFLEQVALQQRHEEIYTLSTIDHKKKSDFLIFFVCFALYDTHRNELMASLNIFRGSKAPGASGEQDNRQTGEWKKRLGFSSFRKIGSNKPKIILLLDFFSLAWSF